jgi:hypothetical protein
MSVVPLTLDQIVENGLCIGCGLCRSIAGSDQVDLVMTPEGRERPVARQALSATTLKRVNAVCPGTRIGGADPAQQSMDECARQNFPRENLAECRGARDRAKRGGSAEPRPVQRSDG